MTRPRTCLAVLTLCFSLTGLRAQVSTVRGRVEVLDASKTSRAPFPSTVVWLTPVGKTGDPAPAAANVALRLAQRNKRFEPHVLVPPAGAAVEFPNHDLFFHNVSSFFEGNRFDFG